ncbi:MAG: T9SS type A sorting domain-containing protein, partial [Saprospiraceae bacterium]|nr:T9SS type A sorting domain-containing protein [Saprospiraceae bacterium]
LYAQTGCPGCVISLPALPEDTIFLSIAPDGQAGQPYSADVSFRMPQTTTPVAASDSTVPPGLTIQQITINSLTNVPPGLNWEVNQTEFNPAEQTDGCVRFCGTPLLAGYYEVSVVVTATVFFVPQTTSFTFPIHILPAVSQTDGFSIVNNAACGAVTASFVNNIPSNGLPGFSYFWNFGNGEETTAENPEDQTYLSPGVYVVDYQAIVDTSDFFLTNVRIESTTCTDLFSGPDLKVRVFDQDNNELYISSIVSNAVPPLDFNLNLTLGDGNYRIQLTDDDGGIDGADDDCGSVNFNRFTTGILNSSGMSASVSILHPIDTIRSSDTVIVYPQPFPPLIFGLPFGPLCDGDSLTLNTTYFDNLQWYRDSVPLLEGTLPQLPVEESGNYWVVYSSPDGCQAHSEIVNLSFGEIPSGIVFTNQNNMLSIFDPGSLPQQAGIQWFLNGEPIAGANGEMYCIGDSGNYTVEVTNLATGCTGSYSQNINYNPGFPNCVTAAGDLTKLTPDMLVAPNPSNGHFDLLLGATSVLEGTLSVVDPFGRLLSNQKMRLSPGQNRQTMDLSQLPAGLYLLQWQSPDGQNVVKALKLD